MPYIFKSIFSNTVKADVWKSQTSTLPSTESKEALAFIVQPMQGFSSCFHQSIIRHLGTAHIIAGLVLWWCKIMARPRLSVGDDERAMPWISGNPSNERLAEVVWRLHLAWQINIVYKIQLCKYTCQVMSHHVAYLSLSPAEAPVLPGKQFVLYSRLATVGLSPRSQSDHTGPQGTSYRREKRSWNFKS